MISSNLITCIQLLTVHQVTGRFKMILWSCSGPLWPSLVVSGYWQTTITIFSQFLAFPELVIRVLLFKINIEINYLIKSNLIWGNQSPRYLYSQSNNFTIILTLKHHSRKILLKIYNLIQLFTVNISWYLSAWNLEINQFIKMSNRII